jgi:hypothetical protein
VIDGVSLRMVLGRMIEEGPALPASSAFA